MPLSSAEKQRLYRLRRKNSPEREAENRRKDRERYHANKRLVRDMTPREHDAMKMKWRVRRRNKALKVMHTSESAPPPRVTDPAPLGQEQFQLQSDRPVSTPENGPLTESTPNPGTSESQSKPTNQSCN